MKTANPYFLYTLLGPLVGLADDDNAVRHFASINSNDEEQVKRVIGEMLLPHFHGLSVEVKERSKTALGYYLVKPDANLKRIFESCLPPFGPPRVARQFFVWLWEVLFPTESFAAIDYLTIREVIDVDEPNRLAARSKRAEPEGRVV